MTMGFGGDDREFQRVADRVERTVVLMGKTFKESQLSPEWVKQLEATGAFAGGADPPIKKLSESIRGLSENTERSLGPVRQLQSLLYGKDLINSFGEALARLGNAAEDMATKFRLGKAAAGELFEELAKKLPIIGNFVEAGRGIREALTGEKAETAKLLQGAEDQNRVYEVRKSAMEAIRDSMKETAALQQRLSFKPTDSQFFISLSTILREGATKGDEAKKRLEGLQERLKALGTEADDANKKLQVLMEANPARVVGTPAGVFPVPMEKSVKDEADRLKSTIASLDKSRANVRDQIADLEKLLKETGGRETFTQLGSLIGAEVTKATEAVKAAIASYLANLPKMTDTTAKAVAEMISQWTHYQDVLVNLDLDLEKKVISPETFKQLQNKAFLDNALGPLGEMLKEKFAAAAAAALHTINLGPVQNVTDTLKKMFADFGDPRKAAASPRGFRSRFLDAESLGRSIQEAAGSTAPNGAAAIAKQQLEVAKAAKAEALKQAQAQTAELIRISRELAKNKAAVVTGP